MHTIIHTNTHKEFCRKVQLNARVVLLVYFLLVLSGDLPYEVLGGEVPIFPFG